MAILNDEGEKSPEIPTLPYGPATPVRTASIPLLRSPVLPENEHGIVEFLTSGRPVRFGDMFPSVQITRVPSVGGGTPPTSQRRHSLEAFMSGSSPPVLQRRTRFEESDFDPRNFDPKSLTFKEACDILGRANLDQYTTLIKETILKYTLCIRKLPRCKAEDLMLAVYLYFEKNLKIKVGLELCVRFDAGVNRGLVGVVLDSVRARDVILRRAVSSRHLQHRILPNEHFSWILDGFCDQ